MTNKIKHTIIVNDDVKIDLMISEIIDIQELEMLTKIVNKVNSVLDFTPKVNTKFTNKLNKLSNSRNEIVPKEEIFALYNQGIKPKEITEILEKKYNIKFKYDYVGKKISYHKTTGELTK